MCTRRVSEEREKPKFVVNIEIFKNEYISETIVRDNVLLFRSLMVK